MKAIILAAGVGSRLRPITNEKPKTLVEVNGKPMLGYLIDNLVENNILDIVICLGYKGDQIIKYCKNHYKQVNFTFIENTDYLDTNNMYSLYLAKEEMNDDIILMNSDLVYGSSIIKGIIKTQGTHVAVDKDSYDDESMKVIVSSEGRIVDIAKTITEADAYGRSIDVYKIVKSDLSVLKENLERIIEQEKDLNQWTEVLLQHLFQNNFINALPFDIKEDKWIEIDNYEDLYEGEKLFNSNYEKLKQIKVVLLDKDGVISIGNKKIPGINSFLKKLDEKGINYSVLSNNSSKTHEDNIKKFDELDIDIKSKDKIILSTDIAVKYLMDKGITKLALCASQKVTQYIEGLGFEIDLENPEAVLLTYDTELNYDKMCTIHSLIKKGIPYYATHLDIVCPTESGNIPDIGSFIALFKKSTGVSPDIIFGKPEKYTIEYVKTKLGVEAENILMIGDRVYTDIALGKHDNILTALVLTGEGTRGDVEFHDCKPHFIINSLNDLNDLL